MTAADQAIVSLYEVSGLTVEQISETQGYDVISVKACLMTNSILYREAVKQEAEVGFTDTEEQEAKKVIGEIMKDEEVDAHTRLRAAIFVRQDKRGRLDTGKKSLSDIRKVNVTIIQFNQQLNRATEARQRAMAMPKVREAIEVNHK
jgi:hypothetical protein